MSSRLTQLMIGAACFAAVGCSRTTPAERTPERDAAPPGYSGYPRVAVGASLSCLLQESGHSTCWGNTLGGQKQPPDGLVDLRIDGLYGCGLVADGIARCWPGPPQYGTPTDMPDGTFTKIDVHASNACALRPDRTLVCWGSKDHGVTDTPGGHYKDVAVGSGFACAVRDDGSAVCWGANGAGQATPPTGHFESIYAADVHACGLIDGELVRCWGANRYGAVQDKRVRALAVGGLGTCAIQLNGTLVCGGAPGRAGPAPITEPPPGQFVQIDLGEHHGCGVRPGGSVECWGEGYYGEQTAPPR